MNIGILGAGSWGIALTDLLSVNNHKLTVWSVDKNEIDMLKQYREHKTKLPGVILKEDVEFTTNPRAAVENMDMLVMVVPSPYIRSTSKTIAPYVKKNQLIVNVSKGIEENTLMTLTDIISEEIPCARVGVLSGPSHAEEVGKHLPTTVVAGAYKKDIAALIQDTFMTDYFRVYTSPDVIGIELGGALKNVIALAAGIADGLGCGDNTKAALITRGIAEITRLGVAMGGKVETFAGLSGIGDLIVTCASKHSRNRNAGFLIGQGKTYKEAMAEVKMVVEGVYSAKAAMALSEEYHIEMPIVKCVNMMLFENLPAIEAMRILLGRDKTKEVETLSWN